MKRLPSGSSPNNHRDVSQVPRGSRNYRELIRRYSNDSML